MKYYTIMLKALSPLSVRADHAAGGAEATKFIPGNTFMGSLAAVHRLLYPELTTEFARLFLNEQVSYPHLYPATFKDMDPQKAQALFKSREKWELEKAALEKMPVYPLPKTAQSCKRHPGFLYPKDSENDAHGVRDTLIDWALFSLSAPPSRQVKTQQDYKTQLGVFKEKKCYCKEVMDHFDGYYRRDVRRPEEMMRVQAHTRLQTHTGINRASGTVEENILYNRLVFEENMRFWGLLKFPDDDEHLLKHFEDFIETVGVAALVRVGTGRTRGMGKVAIKAEQQTEPDAFNAFKARLQSFNTLVQKRLKDQGIPRQQPEFFFALTLQSPLILTDAMLRYSGNIDEKALQKLLVHYPKELPAFQQIYHLASVKRITGWQDLWGLPRTNEYAIDTGSVFLFTCSPPADNTLFNALFKLEEQGIGKRSAEGFGRVSISDQFHQEVQRL